MKIKFLSIVIWLIGVLGVISSSNIQIIYSIANTAIQNDIGLSTVQAALIASLNMIFFSIFQLLSGPIIDFCGIQKILPLSTFLNIVGILLLYSSYNFMSILLSQIFLSLGSSCSFVGASCIGAKYFPKRLFGILLGLVQTIYSLSCIIIQYACVFLMKSQLDWRIIVSYAGYFSFMVLVLLIAAFKIEKSNCLNYSFNQKGEIKQSMYDIMNCIFQVLRRKNLWGIVIIGSMIFGFFLSFAVLWSPRLLMMRNFTEYQSGLATSFIWLGFAIGCPLSSWMNVCKSSNLILLLSYFIQFLCIIFFLCKHGFYLSCFAITLFGVVSGGHVISFVIANNIISSRNEATLISVINAFMSIISGLLMWVISLIVDFYKEYDDIRFALLIFLGIGFTVSMTLYFILQNFNIKDQKLEGP